MTSVSIICQSLQRKAIIKDVFDFGVTKVNLIISDFRRKKNVRNMQECSQRQNLEEEIVAPKPKLEEIKVETGSGFWEKEKM